MRRAGVSLVGGEIAVGLALVVLLGLMVLAAYLLPDAARGPAVFAFAATEALLVALFSMRLRLAPALVALCALAGLFFLGALVTMTATDYPFRQAGERPRAFPGDAPTRAATGGIDPSALP